MKILRILSMLISTVMLMGGLTPPAKAASIVVYVYESEFIPGKGIRKTAVSECKVQVQTREPGGKLVGFSKLTNEDGIARLFLKGIPNNGQMVSIKICSGNRSGGTLTHENKFFSVKH